MFGINTLTSKNACWPLTQNPVDCIFTLALLLVLAVQLINVSPVTDTSCESISVNTHLHNSVSRFAVKSRRSLYLVVMNLSYSPLQVRCPS